MYEDKQKMRDSTDSASVDLPVLGEPESKADPSEEPVASVPSKGDTDDHPQEPHVTILKDDEFRRKRWRSLAVIYFIAFVDLLGFGIVFPVLPVFTLELGASGVWLGIIGTAYPTFSFLASSVWGRVSDTYGRKPVLMMGLIGSTLGHVLLGVSNNLYMIVIARCFSGICGGTPSAAQAYISDVSAPHERAKFMGFLGAAMGVGIVIGPAIGGLCIRWGFHVVAFVAAGITAINLILCLIFLVETKERSKRALTLKMVKEALASRPILLLCISSFTCQLAIVGLELTAAITGVEHFGVTAIDLGILYSMWGVIMAGVQVLFHFFAKRIGAKALCLMALVANSVVISSVPFLPNKAALFGVVALMAFFEGFRMPSMNTLVSLYANSAHFGFTFGVFQAANALARAMSPITSGSLYDWDYRVPYGFASFCLLVAAVMFAFVPKPDIAAPDLPANDLAKKKNASVEEIQSLTRPVEENV